MGKNDRQSRDQKRKAKLKKRAERSGKHESLAYYGRKYKTAEYTPVIYRTEIGIYETFVISGGKLVDDEVESALGQLIARMRRGPLPPLAETGEVTLDGDGDDDEQLIVANIRRNWLTLSDRGELPGRDDLIGVIRTILGSLEVWRSKSLHSQGYLRYLEGFMKSAGVSVRLVSPDMMALPEPEADPLLELGRDWIERGVRGASAGFAEEVGQLLRSGEAERVINVCQQLLGETEDEAIIPHLQAFALKGHHALKAEMG